MSRIIQIIQIEQERSEENRVVIHQYQECRQTQKLDK